MRHLLHVGLKLVRCHAATLSATSITNFCFFCSFFCRLTILEKHLGFFVTSLL